MASENEITLNLSTIAKHFSDEEAAYELIESLRWPDGPSVLTAVLSITPISSLL